jgi:hypothetical protein
LAIIILLDSSEVLKIPDPSVSEIEQSGVAELGSAEQIVALHIGQKSEHPIWQTGTSGFSKKPNIS